MNKRLLTAAYVISDWFSAVISWTVLYVFRKVVIEESGVPDGLEILADRSFVGHVLPLAVQDLYILVL